MLGAGGLKSGMTGPGTRRWGSFWRPHSRPARPLFRASPPGCQSRARALEPVATPAIAPSVPDLEKDGHWRQGGDHGRP